MIEKVNGSDCTACVHHRVCSYVNDLKDIRDAIARATVNIPEPDGRVRIKKVTTYDFMDEIVINCKHYQKETPTMRTNSITTNTTTDYGLHLR